VALAVPVMMVMTVIMGMTVVVVVVSGAALFGMRVVVGRGVVVVDPNDVGVGMAVHERSVAVLVCVRRVLILYAHVPKRWHRGQGSRAGPARLLAVEITAGRCWRRRRPRS
jgi:hypothetical protein